MINSLIFYNRNEEINVSASKIKTANSVYQNISVIFCNLLLTMIFCKKIMLLLSCSINLVVFDSILDLCGQALGKKISETSTLHA